MLPELFMSIASVPHGLLHFGWRICIANEENGKIQKIGN